MEQIIRDTFGQTGYFVIPIISGILISFLAEALNKITPQIINNHLLLFIINIATTTLVIFTFPSYFENDIAELIFAFVINLSFAYVFYYTLGKKVIEAIMKSVEKKIIKEDEKE
jgi:high-affinity K+ transport system ATPase subunit B